MLVIIIRSVWLHTHTDKHAHIRKRKHRRERGSYVQLYVRGTQAWCILRNTPHCLLRVRWWHVEVWISKRSLRDWKVHVQFEYFEYRYIYICCIYNSAYYMKMYNLVIDIDDFLLLFCKVLLRAVNLTNSDIFHRIVIWMKYGIIGTCTCE